MNFSNSEIQKCAVFIPFWEDLSLWSVAAVQALEEFGFTCSPLSYFAILITLPAPEWNSVFFPQKNQFFGNEKPCKIIDGCPRVPTTGLEKGE